MNHGGASVAAPGGYGRPLSASHQRALQHEEFHCTNNQTEYEALLFGLIMLRSMEVKHVEAYGDSLLVVQQVAGEFQCLEGSLRACINDCFNILDYFAEFGIRHIPRHENQKANMLSSTSIWL